MYDELSLSSLKHTENILNLHCCVSHFNICQNSQLIKSKMINRIQRNLHSLPMTGKSMHSNYLVISCQCVVTQQGPVVYSVRSVVDKNCPVLYLQDLDAMSHHR